MIHIALRIAYWLILAWVGLNVLLVISLGLVMLYDRRTTVTKEQQSEYSLTD
jgi:hypothetical protein